MKKNIIKLMEITPLAKELEKELNLLRDKYQSKIPHSKDDIRLEVSDNNFALKVQIKINPDTLIGIKA